MNELTVTAANADEQGARLPGYATLSPGYFALVMATGIVSIAASQQGFGRLADVLLWVNGVAFAVLCVLTLARVVRYPARLVDDLVSHQRGAAFLTTVAGTSVLGSQVALLTSNTGVGVGLWLLAGGLWAVLLYAFFAAVTVREPKPGLEEGLNGTWLLLIVSTESIAVLGALIAPHLGRTDLVVFVSVCAHLVGLMLYIVVIGMVFYRWTFLGLTPSQLTPPYWINMGALAITTLAAANLLGASDTWAGVEQLKPFLTGTMLLAWSFATWWIPLLVAVGVWRHVVQRTALRYDPQYWALVFPLGMYSAATYKMKVVLQLGFLTPVSAVFFWVALAAWAVTFLAMAAALSRRRPRPG
jgi:tellurite resistance protein TehA-like permease